MLKQKVTVARAFPSDLEALQPQLVTTLRIFTGAQIKGLMY
ncbi:MAG: hypothetical protein ACE5IR_22325 [bacterium]